MDIAQMLKEKREIKRRKKLYKELVKQYPWLKPRNVWTDKVDEDYDYSWMWIEPDEDGWQKAFFYYLMEDMKKELEEKDFVEQFRINEYKSKYGTMRLYGNAYLKSVNDYEYMSANICEVCGRPDVGSTSGWITPICCTCFEKYYNDTRPYEEAVDQEHSRIPDTYSIRHYDADGEWIEKRDIKAKANKIRYKWNHEHPEDPVMIEG